MWLGKKKKKGLDNGKMKFLPDCFCFLKAWQVVRPGWRNPQPTSPASSPEGFWQLSSKAPSCLLPLPPRVDHSESLQKLRRHLRAGKVQHGHFSQCFSNFPAHGNPLGACQGAEQTWRGKSSALTAWHGGKNLISGIRQTGLLNSDTVLCC